MRFSNYESKLNYLRENGTTKGLFCGFDALDDILSFKLGYPIWIAGSPASGKTEFLIELCLILSMFYGFKGAVYLGETGDPENIIAELCYKYIKKPYLKKYSNNRENENAMSDNERFNAELFLNEHIVIIDDLHEDFKDGFTMTNFLKHIQTIEKERNFKISYTAIDPFNYLAKTDVQTNRDDIYLEQTLRSSIKDGRLNNRINFLVNHVTKIPPILDKESGKRYIPEALPQEWANGQVWHRMAYQMLYCYRPPIFLKDETGLNIYKENQSVIINQKAKPKGIAVTGERSIFWDKFSNRYYEIIDGREYYFHEKKINNIFKQEKLPF